MSLTARLLLNQPTQLPQGRMREHCTELPPTVMTGNLVANGRVKARNIEAVYAAVAAGHEIIDDIMVVARLSKTTVQKALNALHTWPGGPRIDYTRNKRQGQQGGNAYRWKVVA